MSGPRTGQGRLPVAGGAQVYPEAPLTLEGDDVGGDVGQLQQHARQCGVEHVQVVRGSPWLLGRQQQQA